MTTHLVDIEDTQLVRKLGGGGFGEVWLAADPSQKDIAVKFLNLPEEKRYLISLFKQEFSILSEIRHRHLARVFDFGFSKKRRQYFFTEEYFPGTNFASAVADKPLEYLEEGLVQILTALDHIHSRGILHGDIKPDNILVLDEDGTPSVKLVDFGIASRLGVTPAIGAGTPAYMSPEVILKKPGVDHRADLYSVGMLCLMITTGRHPFKTRTTEEMMRWHVSGKIPENIWEGKTIPRHLRELTVKLLEKNPADRFTNARVTLRFINRTTSNRFEGSERKMSGRLPDEGPLVGREAILESINRKLEDLSESGNGHDVTILTYGGEKGIGKTRLLDEVRRLAELKEVPFLSWSCLDTDPWWPRLARWTGSSETITETDDPLWKIRRQAAAIVDHAHRSPFCLLIDDRHNADTELLSLLHELSTRKAPLLVVATTEEKKDGIVELSRLTKDEIARYLELLFGPLEKAGEIAEKLGAYSGGLPFLMAEGVRFIAPKILDGDPTEELLFPPSVGALYQGKIGNLKEDEREFLEILSLLNREVGLETLINILAEEAENISGRAQAGIREDLVIGLGAFLQERKYRILNQALGLHLISQILPERLARHHLKIAAGLAKTSGAASGEIGLHFAAGGQPQTAVTFFLKAGRELQEKRDVAGALPWFVRASSLIPEQAAEKSAVLKETIRLLIQTAHYREAEDEMNKLTGDSFESESLKGWLAFKQRQFGPSRENYEKALRLASPGKPVERIKTLNCLANIDLQTGSLNEAIVRFTESCQEEKRLGKEERKTIDNNNLGAALALAGKFTESVNFYKKRLAGLDDDQKTRRIFELNGLGYALILASRFGEAIVCLKEARELVHEIGTSHTLFSILGNLSTASVKEGLYADALEALTELLALQKRLGSTRDMAYALLRQGGLYVLLGMEEAGSRALSEGQEKARAIGDCQLEGWLLMMEAYREREFGQIEKADELLSRVETIARSLKDPTLLAWICLTRADLAFEKGEHKVSVKLLKEIGFEPADDEWRTRKKLLEAKLLARSESEKEALKIFSILEKNCQKNHYLELLWEVCHGWGQALLKLNDRKGAAAVFRKGIETLQSVVDKLPEEFRDRYWNQRGRQAFLRDCERIRGEKGSAG